MTNHTHHLSDGQLICDNEQCREKVREQIHELNNEIKLNFDTIIEKNTKTENQIDNIQGWKIMYLLSQKLSDRLVSIFHKEEIHRIIEHFIQQNQTKQAFEKAFDYKNEKNFITKEELWNIYINMCDDAVRLLSKAKNERKIHVANFCVVNEN